jgi:hypothetical protein
MEHIVRFERGHDCIRFKCINDSPKCIPGKGGSHGVGGMQIRFIVKGDAGAVQFLVSTGWLPRAVSKKDFLWESDELSSFFPSPVDLGYHSKTPRYEGQSSMGKCEWCDGLDCYYDGSGLNAINAMYTLVNGGDAALWEFLEQYYHYVFSGGAYPKTIEYIKPLRD